MSRRATKWGVSVVALAALLSCQEPSSAPARQGPKHVILVTVDTLRGDHFLTSKAGVPVTPNLEEFASRAIRFERAYSTANTTSPGIATILTGLLPKRNGVLVNDHVLSSRVPSLARRLGEAGFTTVAYVANPVLAPGFGFEQGFATYEIVNKEPPYRKAKAEAVTDLALRTLEGLEPDQRLFLWVHYMDPHGPYQPPDDIAALFSLQDFEGPTEVVLLPEGDQSGFGGIPFYQQYGQDPKSQDSRDYQLRYAAEIRAFDREVARLLGGLESNSLLEEAVLVVSSDHGEAMSDDHGFFFSHANSLTEDQIGVPLLLYYPGCEEGVRIGDAVSTVDIVPTIYDLIGLRTNDDLDGFSLLTNTRPSAFSQSLSEETVTVGPWRLRWQRELGFQLFNLVDDPEETADRSADRPEVVRELKALLGEMRRKEPLTEPIKRHDPDEKERERLRALGYL